MENGEQLGSKNANNAHQGQTQCVKETIGAPKGRAESSII